MGHRSRLPAGLSHDGRDTQVEWIGAHLRVTGDHLRVEIPESKLSEAQDSSNLLLGGPVALRRDVRSLAGKLPVLCRLGSPPPGVCHAPVGGGIRGGRRPWSMSRPSAARFGGSTPSSGRPTARSGERSPWASSPPGNNSSIVTDASPWGMGAVLCRDTVPIAYWADPSRSPDVRAFNATIGDPAFNSLWEGLAVLVSVQAWATELGPHDNLVVRSDNIGFLQALAERRAAAPALTASCRIYHWMRLRAMTRSLHWLTHPA